MKNPLSITHPQIAAQWHPTKNGTLTPNELGFDVVSVQDMGQFTHIRALKTERRPQEIVKLRF